MCTQQRCLRGRRHFALLEIILPPELGLNDEPFPVYFLKILIFFCLIYLVEESLKSEDVLLIISRKDEWKVIVVI